MILLKPFDAKWEGWSRSATCFRIGAVPKLAFLPVCFLLTLLLAGCQSQSDSQYVSPRVTGRVLDAQTHQPVPDVRVRRVSANESLRELDAPKGGQMMEQAPAARTGADGAFVLDSVTDLSFFRKLGWYSVTLSFEHPHYERFVTTYTLKDATNTTSGEPWVKAKDILLFPLAR